MLWSVVGALRHLAGAAPQQEALEAVGVVILVMTAGPQQEAEAGLRYNSAMESTL